MKKNLFIPVTEAFHQIVKEYCIKKKITVSGLVVKLLLKEMSGRAYHGTKS